MEDLSKKGTITTINAQGFTYVYSQRLGKALACLTIKVKDKLVNCFIGDKSEYSITDLVQLSQMTLTVESRGETAPDESGRKVLNLLIINYAPRAI